jgi:hypothetical protein
VVLSACSSFFQKLLSENPCKHPTIIMPKEIPFVDLQFIIEFVYRGEIDVSEAELQVSKLFLFSEMHNCVDLEDYVSYSLSLTCVAQYEEKIMNGVRENDSTTYTRK